MVDALRADRVDCAGTARPTPTLQALCAQSLVFPRAISHGPDTRSALPALLTGLSAQGPWLGERFSALGYQTALFSGNPWIQAPLTQGFGHQEQLDYSYIEGARRDGADLVAALSDWLAQAPPGPVLTWTQLMDVHHPLSPPAPYAGRYASPGPVPSFNGPIVHPPSAEELQRLQDRTDEAVAWTDALLGRALAAIEARGRPALVVLTSDHGEALGEHGQMGHGLALTPEILRVPLLLRGAGRVGVVPEAVAHQDLLPTLLLAAGAPEDLPGVDLRGEIPPDRIFPVAGQGLEGEVRWPALYAEDAGWNLETGQALPGRPLQADRSGFRKIPYVDDARGRLQALGY